MYSQFAGSWSTAPVHTSSVFYTRILLETALKTLVKINHKHCSPSIHQATHLILDENVVGFVLHKAPLTAFNYLFFHMSRNKSRVTLQWHWPLTSDLILWDLFTCLHHMHLNVLYYLSSTMEKTSSIQPFPRLKDLVFLKNFLLDNINAKRILDNSTLFMFINTSFSV